MTPRAGTLNMELSRTRARLYHKSSSKFSETSGHCAIASREVVKFSRFIDREGPILHQVFQYEQIKILNRHQDPFNIIPIRDICQRHSTAAL